MIATDLLIPVRRYQQVSGTFAFPKEAILASPSSADLLPFGQLADELAPYAVRARIVRNAFGPATVRVRRQVAAPRGAPPSCGDAYRLAISPDGIDIAACGDAGAYYAVQTLRDLLTIHGRRLPGCVIEDWPDFARRGIYHDCSRGKVPRLATLKDLVERLARWKINELQLYVENVFTFKRHPDIGKGFSPFTPQELLELQDFCKLHHVRLVGSLASFGHLEKILSLPAYQHLGEMYGCSMSPGQTLCPIDPESIQFLGELYEEFVPLFEAKDFNICGDETNDLGRGRSKEAASKVGVGRLYAGFLKKIYNLCQKHGKRMNAWSDVVLEHPELLNDLPTDIVMLNWEYDPDGARIPRTHEITDAGLPLVVCPGTNAWRSHGCRLRMGMENIAIFAREGLARGAEGLLNTDWGDDGHRNMLAVSLHNLAYGAAQSWRGAGATDQGFTERFCLHTFGRGFRNLADGIRTLGDAEGNLKLSRRNRMLLYRTFTGPIAEYVEEERWARLHEVTPANLRKHYDALAAIRWPPPRKGMDRLLARTLEEFALAARLDMVACLRVALLKQLRRGKAPAAAQLKKLIAATEDAISELKRVWSLGNKSSRLADNVNGIKQAIREYRRLST